MTGSAAQPVAGAAQFVLARCTVEGGTALVDLKDKLVLALGERDGVPAPALQACVESAGGQVIYAETQCFV